MDEEDGMAGALASDMHDDCGWKQVPPSASCEAPLCIRAADLANAAASPPHRDCLARFRCNRTSSAGPDNLFSSALSSARAYRSVAAA
jgi:hypothetical protein